LQALIQQGMLLLVLQVRVGICWQVALPEDAVMIQLAGDQRWLDQASTSHKSKRWQLG
jgi:hypothetical protein